MNRRKFLSNTLPAAVTLPAFLNGFSFTAYGNSPYHSLSRLLGPDATNDHILVLVQLAGGNDGLNMVIPLDMYANYYNARQNVAIQQSRVLRLDGTDRTGLHPAMTDMQNMYNEGKINIVCLSCFLLLLIQDTVMHKQGFAHQILILNRAILSIGYVRQVL